MRRETRLAVCVALATSTLSGVAAAQDTASSTLGTKQAGDILLRGRAIAVVPDGGGTTRVLGGDLEVDTQFAPEVDISYFITKNIAVELIAATVKHNIDLKNSSAGDVDLGSVRVLPPTLSLQYHFFTDEIVSPYLGVGVSYTVFWDESEGPTLNSLNVDNAWGYAFQAGVDFQFPYSNFVFNLDAKRLFLSPHVDAEVGGQELKVRNFDLDPWIVGIGFGYKF